MKNDTDGRERIQTAMKREGLDFCTTLFVCSLIRSFPCSLALRKTFERIWKNATDDEKKQQQQLKQVQNGLGLG